MRLINKMNRKKIIQLIYQFIKFGIVGLSNTIVSMSIYYLFIYINTEYYLWGSFIGWVISVLNAFYWGNKFVFNDKENKQKKIIILLLKSYVTYGSTFLLTQILLYLEISVWGMSEWIAPIVNLLITIPLNFIINKFWTFKKIGD